MSGAVHVAILGGSGYGAGELLRLCTQHPAVEVVSVSSRTRAGEPLARVHPHLRGFYELEFCAAPDYERLLAAAHAVVFSALPNGASAPAIDRLLAELERRGVAGQVRVIDLSGDLRLTDARLHRRHYPQTPELPQRRREFVYGLPELFAEQVRAARRVANPGCLASAAILAAAPLARRALRAPLAIDVKTGSSGAGRELKETTHHPTRHADFRAYRPLAHQHEAEVLQALGDPQGQRLRTSFVAQSMDLARGVYVTVHAQLAEPAPAQRLRQSYADFYADQPFVRIVPDPPRLQDVVGSNFCDIALAGRGPQVVAMAALDNLVKGMAGTALQNLNLMCGLPQTTGLWLPAYRPL